MPDNTIRGRFAPSPSGRLHLGNMLTFLLAWLDVRARGGTMVFRLEDLDPERSWEHYADLMADDLLWLGLDWDEGWCPGSQDCRQGTRTERYTAALDALTAQMEAAKAELGKPFPQEEELRVKSARLAELNAELNIDERTPMEQLADDAAISAKAERPSVLARLKAPLSQPRTEEKVRHKNKEER